MHLKASISGRRCRAVRAAVLNSYMYMYIYIHIYIYIYIIVYSTSTLSGDLLMLDPLAKVTASVVLSRASLVFHESSRI